jgi:hypothetical protein
VYNRSLFIDSVEVVLERDRAKGAIQDRCDTVDQFKVLLCNRAHVFIVVARDRRRDDKRIATSPRLNADFFTGEPFRNILEVELMTGEG